MTSKETKKRPVNKPKDEDSEDYSLILYNDDFHSFDYVVGALVEICGHQYEQALQCTLITDHKGACTIRKGKKELLNTMKEALTERELNTAIDTES